MIERLIPQAAERLRPGGHLLMEISPMIHDAVRTLLEADGRFELGPTIKDLARLPRVVQARKGQPADRGPHRIVLARDACAAQLSIFKAHCACLLGIGRRPAEAANDTCPLQIPSRVQPLLYGLKICADSAASENINCLVIVERNLSAVHGLIGSLSGKVVAPMIRHKNLRWFLVLSLLSAAVWSAGISLGIAQWLGEPAAASVALAAPKVRRRRQCLGVDLLGPGAVHDGAGTGAVLLRAGAQEKRAERHDAVRLSDVPDDGPLGPVRLFAGLRRRRRLDRRRPLPVHARRRRRVDQQRRPTLPLFPGLTIPVMTHMLFQGMFFIITPALICGAFAERMKFSTMVVFMILWGTLIYCPLAHWIWGGGLLAYGSPHAESFRPAGPWTLPAERWSTSVPACRP